MNSGGEDEEIQIKPSPEPKKQQETYSEVTNILLE